MTEQIINQSQYVPPAITTRAGGIVGDSFTFFRSPSGPKAPEKTTQVKSGDTPFKKVSGTPSKLKSLIPFFNVTSNTSVKANS